MKFTDEELEGLSDIRQHYGFKALTKLIKSLAEAQASSMLNYNLSEGDAQKLAYLHSQITGAKKLEYNILDFFNKLHSKSGRGVRR